MNFKLNKSISAVLILILSLLATSVMAKRWQPWSIELERVELGDGVYAVYDSLAKEWLEKYGASAGTSSGFIVGERGVFVVDSLVNPHLTSQLMRLIKEVTSKPVLYVVNTSYHGDHMYGNYMFPNSTIIQHEESKKYFDHKLQGDLLFMENMFGHPEGLDNMDNAISRTGDILLGDGVSFIRVDLGDRMVEVHQFGFGQTLGDLQVWVPDAKVFWVGNAVVSPKPGVPWLTEGGQQKSLETLRKIKAFLPKDATIVAGHSIATKLSAKNNGLDWHIDYLSTLDRMTREAVEQGMDLVDTVDYAAMEKFNGYDLYNWNHKQMNIPCAYRSHMMAMGKEISEDESPMMRHCTNNF